MICDRIDTAHPDEDGDLGSEGLRAVVVQAIRACRSYEALDALESRIAAQYEYCAGWPTIWLAFRRGYRHLTERGCARRESRPELSIDWTGVVGGGGPAPGGEVQPEEDGEVAPPCGLVVVVGDPGGDERANTLQLGIGEHASMSSAPASRLRQPRGTSVSGSDASGGSQSSFGHSDHDPMTFEASFAVRSSIPQSDWELFCTKAQFWVELCARAVPTLAPKVVVTPEVFRLELDDELPDAPWMESLWVDRQGGEGILKLSDEKAGVLVYGVLLLLAYLAGREGGGPDRVELLTERTSPELLKATGVAVAEVLGLPSKPNRLSMKTVAGEVRFRLRRARTTASQPRSVPS